MTMPRQVQIYDDKTLRCVSHRVVRLRAVLVNFGFLKNVNRSLTLQIYPRKQNYCKSFIFLLFYWVFSILFIQYYSVIRRHSDHTVGSPRAGRDSNPAQASQRQGHYP